MQQVYLPLICDSVSGTSQGRSIKPRHEVGLSFLFNSGLSNNAHLKVWSYFLRLIDCSSLQPASKKGVCETGLFVSWENEFISSERQSMGIISLWSAWQTWINSEGYILQWVNICVIRLHMKSSVSLVRMCWVWQFHVAHKLINYVAVTMVIYMTPSSSRNICSWNSWSCQFLLNATFERQFLLVYFFEL